MNARGFFHRGRVAQKRRTRQSLIEAGLRVLERGEEPTLESVAREADVSRATAYRYFPRIEALLSILPLARLVGEPEEILDGIDDDQPVEAALQVQRYFFDLAVGNELAFRRFLHAILDEQLREGLPEDFEPLRGHYRLKTLGRALGSLEGSVDPGTLERLRIALVALTGIEALLAVKDVLGLDPETGREGLEWAARTLVTAAMTESE